MSKSTGFSPIRVEQIVDNVFIRVIDSCENLSDEELAQIEKEILFIKESIRGMVQQREAAKLIINIGERGDIVPEVHLKGSAEVKQFEDDKE